jgi:hypothetical protein
VLISSQAPHFQALGRLAGVGYTAAAVVPRRELSRRCRTLPLVFAEIGDRREVVEPATCSGMATICGWRDSTAWQAGNAPR